MPGIFIGEKQTLLKFHSSALRKGKKKKRKGEKSKSHSNAGGKVIFPLRVIILTYIEAFHIKCVLLRYA